MRDNPMLQHDSDDQYKTIAVFLTITLNFTHQNKNIVTILSQRMLKFVSNKIPPPAILGAIELKP
jgi:hypothetical protein